MDIREEQLTIRKIDSILESKKETPRTYLGVSYIGEECLRYIWLKFRWVHDETLTGQKLRLLNRGHREEANIVRLLKKAGVDVQETGAKQREVVLTPWIKGHLDGIIKSGLLESPTNEHILEMKTCGVKTFGDLVKKGVQIAKPVHYAQTQVYMLGTGIKRAFYWSVCKDTDEVYTERLHLDEDFAKHAVTRGTKVVEAIAIPETLGGATFFKCKMCSYYAFCHGKDNTVSINCRTCQFVEFTKEGIVLCTKNQRQLSAAMQVKACGEYVAINLSKKEVMPWD